ncbi:MAG: MBL fold metallo-hydrolase [Desulfobacterales bacterium]|nr:MBL fold metallo-hydrolase [Desulfobacterales bacterium]
MIIKSLPVGPIMANCYILGCDKTLEAAVIDPGDDADQILAILTESGLKLKYILNTHGHFDHVGGNRGMKAAAADARLMIHRLDAPMLDQLATSASMFGLRAENSPPPDAMLEDGQRLVFGEIELTVIHTPGHSPGGVAFLADGHVFVGDTLFQGSIGRTDLPGGDYDTLIDSIRTRLFPLGDEIQVHPGHMGPTTIGQEKRTNPFAGIK